MLFAIVNTAHIRVYIPLDIMRTKNRNEPRNPDKRSSLSVIRPHKELEK